MPIKRRFNFDPASLSPEEQQQLGRLVSWWGYLEYQAAVLVRVCSNGMSKEDMWLSLIGSEVRTLTKMLRALAFTDHWIKDRSFREEIDLFADDFEKAATDRNVHVHGVYGYVENNQARRVRFSFTPRGHRATPGFVRLDEAQLTGLADKAEELLRRAQDLTDRLKPYMKGQRKASKKK